MSDAPQQPPQPQQPHPSVPAPNGPAPAPQPTWPGGYGPPSGAPVPLAAPAAAAPVTKPAGSFRRGFGWAAGASLAVWLVLGVLGGVTSLLLGLLGVGLLAAASGGAETGPATTTIWGEDDAAGRLLAVQVNGVILGSPSDGSLFGGGTYGYELADTIDALDADDADGLVLEMNTPGGTIYGSRAIGDAVERYQERTGHPVVAYVRGISASGGMFAMAGADEIIADRGTLVGSIGVVSGPFERYRDVVALQGSLLAPGVETRGGITSEYLSQGRGKDFGNPYRDMTEEERAVWTAGLEREYAEFVGWVSQHRNIPEQVIRDDLGAFVYDAYTAVDNGLVDEVMGQEEAFRHAAELGDLDPDDTRVDRVQAAGLFDSLLAARSGAQPGSGVPSDTGTGTAAPGAATGAGATATVCAGPPVVLAYHGDLGPACGS